MIYEGEITMKVIVNIMSIIIAMVLGGMIAFTVLDVVPNYANAQEFSNLTNWDKVIMYETDNAHFWELKNSYTIIDSIPLLRETL